MDLSRRSFATGIAAMSLAGRVAAQDSAARPWPYLIGADVSFIPQDEDAGALYFDDGIQKDPLQILKAAGFNAIKLRLFVNPEFGYSKAAPEKRWCGLEQTIAFARRVKAAGFHLSLIFHYSDDWADPEHQLKPAAWSKLSFASCVDAVYKHTTDSLAAMKAAGCAPDLVLIGNETTFGTLWPDARIALTIPTGNPVTDGNHMSSVGIGGYDNFAAVLKAGIAGARDTLPEVKATVHNHLGRHWPIVQSWMDNLLKRDVRFDAVGFSCYQQLAEGDWKRTFGNFSNAYPQTGFFVAEYSSRKQYLNDLVHEQPRGWGSWIWEPTRHQEAIFDKEGGNAGDGPRPNLLSQGANAAEAPGAALQAAAPRKRKLIAGRYDTNSLLDTYRTMSKTYQARPKA